MGPVTCSASLGCSFSDGWGRLPAPEGLRSISGEMSRIPEAVCQRGEVRRIQTGDIASAPSDSSASSWKRLVLEVFQPARRLPPPASGGPSHPGMWQPLSRLCPPPRGTRCVCCHVASLLGQPTLLPWAPIVTNKSSVTLSQTRSHCQGLGGSTPTHPSPGDTVQPHHCPAGNAPLVPRDLVTVELLASLIPGVIQRRPAPSGIFAEPDTGSLHPSI